MLSFAAGAGLNPHWNVHANLSSDLVFLPVYELHECSGQGSNPDRLGANIVGQVSQNRLFHNFEQMKSMGADHEINDILDLIELV